MSYEDRNQFMPQNQQNQNNQNNDPMFINFMQSCFNNPSFFQSMIKHYNNIQSQSITNNNRNQTSNVSYNSLNSSITQSQPNLNQDYIPPNYKMEDSRTQYNQVSRVADSNIYNNFKKQLKNVGNPLQKYTQNQVNINKDQGQKQNQKKIVMNKNINFQDQPISSSYITDNVLPNNQKSKNSFNLNAIKENQSINFQGKYENWDQRPITTTKINNYNNKTAQLIDEKPIKSMKQEDYQQYYQDFNSKSTMKNNTKRNQINNKASQQITRKKLYNQAEQRPLTGAGKDFQLLIKEQLKSQKYTQNDDNQQYNQNKSQNNFLKTQTKSFLKRGSRQHLSSAINKSKPPKQNNKDQQRNDMDRSRSITPVNKNDVKSVSQNRVLGKRSIKDKQSDKTSNKQISHNDQQPPYQRIKPQQKPKPKPIQTKQTKLKPQKPSPLNNKKKKTKNVFDDSGQSSSSSQQQQFFTSKNQKAEQSNNYSNNNRIQVIQNVYLTNEQLQQILLKYGKKPKVEQTESQKIQSLRNKYSELCRLAELQKQQNLQKLQKQREQFQKYKSDQISKLKNQRRVMQRQLKGGPSSAQNIQKERQQIQQMKQQIQRQRQQYKRKDKTNKIIMQKYKKQNQQLKLRLQRSNDYTQKQVFVNKDKQSNNKKINNKTQQNINDDKIDKTLSKYSINSNNNKKKEDDGMKEEIYQKDNRKEQDKTNGKEKQKIKYGYVEQDDNTFIKNKSTSIKNQVSQNKLSQNKWNAKFGAHSSSDQSDQSDQQLSANKKKLLQWSPAMKLSDLTKIELSIKMVNEKMINSLFKFENIVEYQKYLQIKGLSTRTIVNTSKNTKNGYVANLYSDRSKQLIYDNGTKKQSFQNGYSIVYFKNGDKKQILADKTVLYYFHEKQVDQITLSNGVNIYRFQNNQVQFHFENGYIEIRHPEGTIKVLGDKCTRR